MKTTEQIVKLDRGFPGGYVAGTIVRWRNGIPADWAERSSPYSGPVPADCPILDAAESLMASQQTPVTPPPDRRLTSADLWKKLPWSKNPETFERAVSQFGFPRPLLLSDRNNLLNASPVNHAWSEASVDRWLVEQRVKIKELQQLVD